MHMTFDAGRLELAKPIQKAIVGVTMESVTEELKHVVGWLRWIFFVALAILAVTICEAVANRQVKTLVEQRLDILERARSEQQARNIAQDGVNKVQEGINQMILRKLGVQ